MVLAGTCYLKSKSLCGALSMRPIHSIQHMNNFAEYFSGFAARSLPVRILTASGSE
jgi:hypothetical protein